MLGVVVRDHQGQLQLLATLARQRQADQTTAIAGHEINILGAHPGSRHDEITLILAVFVIHQDHHLALTDIFDDLFAARIEAGCFQVEADMFGCA